MLQDTNDDGTESGDEWTYSTEQYLEDVSSSRDESAEGGPIGVGDEYAHRQESGDYERTITEDPDGSNYRTLYRSVSGEEEVDIGADGIGGAIPDWGVTEYQDESEQVNVTRENATVPDRISEDTGEQPDQTPDQDVYEWNGNVPGETATAEDAEVSAGPSDTAEQDPSLSGEGVVTGGADPYQPPTSGGTPDPAPGGGSAGGFGAMGVIVLAGIAAVAASRGF